MKTINVVMDDADFAKLDKAKFALSTRKGRVVSWREYLLAKV